MASWSQHHDLVYAFVCVSFLADGEVEESEKEAMRGNVKVMLPDVSDEEYNSMEAEVINKFIELGDESSVLNTYIYLFIGSIFTLPYIFYILLLVVFISVKILLK